jgi:phenylacetic acid degradation protein paaN
MGHKLFEKHRATLEGALKAIESRAYWSPYPEIPSGKIYGETAKADGLRAFEARLNKPFELDQPGNARTGQSEVSPYGMKLGIDYPKPDLDELIPAMQTATRGWRKASIEARVGVCLEILDRLSKNAFEMANAIMHTTGQSFMMAFQAGGPHALDRALEAVAYAYQEMTRCPQQVTWEKQVGKTEVIRLQKTYRIVPRGLAVLIGCSTFPTWNGYPGLFASLVTGNAVAVKPHHGAILPMALTVATARAVLKESDFDPNLVTLVPNSIDGHSISKELATRPEVGIIDYTGGTEFGDWLETNCRQAVVFTEKAGVNSIVLDSVDDLKAVTGNIAFSVSLYSGQMCTAPQNIFIPKSGIRSGDRQITFDEAAQAVVGAVNRLLSDPKRAVEVLGAIQNESTIRRIAKTADEGGEVLRRSEPVAHERYPQARVRSPLILKVGADRKDLYMREVFGPIVYIVQTESTAQSIELAADAARECGAITSVVYSTDADVLRQGQDALTEAGVPVSCNLTGQIFVNQAAAFSDFHVSGANPAGNATLCDAAFVVNRFRIVHTRVQV